MIPAPPFGRDVIASILPHRDPFLLLDEVTELEPGSRVAASYRVPEDGWWFAGHFPERPVMPGVLIVEAMAQCGGLLLMDELEGAEDKVVYFMTMDNVKFRRPVVPGDTLVFELEVLQLRRGVCKMRGEALVEGKLAAEAEFMASIVDK